MNKKIKSDIDNKSEKVLTDLTLGKREPETENEKVLKAEIDEIEASGGMVEIPSDV